MKLSTGDVISVMTSTAHFVGTVVSSDDKFVTIKDPCLVVMAPPAPMSRKPETTLIKAEEVLALTDNNTVLNLSLASVTAIYDVSASSLSDYQKVINNTPKIATPNTGIILK